MIQNDHWNCAIAVCAFNRPKYLEKCLEYLSKTPDIIYHKVPVYIFCDGGKNATQKENSDIIAKYMFITDVFYQSENLCIAKHIHHIKETIFNNFNFDRLMFIEDDVVVSPYYYRFMNRALDCYNIIDPTIGMINSILNDHKILSEKFNTQTWFGDMYSNINQYIMLKNTWVLIKPVMEEYIERFVISSDNNYVEDHDGIIKWARDKIDKFDTPVVREKPIYLGSSQDSITNMAMRINNIKYVSSYVNRFLDIGEYGYHSTEQLYKESKFNEVVLDIMPNDANEINSIWYIDHNKEYACQIGMVERLNYSLPMEIL